MLVRDIMTTNVVTVPSSTPILEARKIMEVHNIRRLPVVDRHKLVGIVTRNMTRRAAPSEATSLSVWEINYLLAKMKVADIMKRDVVTVSPDITVECAVATAQERGVGALPVIEDGLVVGIVTTNDFVYRIMNPLLGLGKPGVRVHIYDCGTTQKIYQAVGAVARAGLELVAIHVDLGIPGYSEECRRIVEKVCGDLGLELHVHDLKKREGYGIPDFMDTPFRRRICGACGTVKRYHTNRMAYELEADRLATGHNLDDTVEILFELYPVSYTHLTLPTN